MQKNFLMKKSVSGVPPNSVILNMNNDKDFRNAKCVCSPKNVFSRQLLKKDSQIGHRKSKIRFSMEKFRTKVFQYFITAVKIFNITGQLSTYFSVEAFHRISSRWLVFKSPKHYDFL